MRQELHIFAFVYMYLDASCRFRVCDNDFGITPVGDITIGITCTVFCFHIALISVIIIIITIITIIGSVHLTVLGTAYSLTI
jgi:hypothetical protein